MIIAWLLVTGGISYSVMINHNNIFTNKIKKFVCYITNTRKKNTYQDEQQQLIGYYNHLLVIACRYDHVLL